jgi:hypothetical protein
MASQDTDSKSDESQLIIKKPDGTEVVITISCSPVISGLEFTCTYEGRLKEVM